MSQRVWPVIMPVRPKANTTGLPPGCKLQAIGPHGWAYWTKTAKITVDDNGETRHYFLKVSLLLVPLD